MWPVENLPPGSLAWTFIGTTALQLLGNSWQMLHKSHRGLPTSLQVSEPDTQSLKGHAATLVACVHPWGSQGAEPLNINIPPSSPRSSEDGAEADEPGEQHRRPPQGWPPSGHT